MRKYTVELDADTEDDLADITLRAKDVVAVVRADAVLAAALSVDPIGRGVPVAEGMYRLTVAPLVYLYGVDAARRHVQVLGVRTVT